MASIFQSVGTSEWITFSINIIMISISIYFNIRFIKAYIKNRADFHTKLFWTSQIFFTFSLGSMIALSVRSIIGLHPLIRPIQVICYGNQIGFLLMVLFLRLKEMFDETMFAISKTTNNLFMSIWFLMYCSIPILFILSRMIQTLLTIISFLFGISGILNIIISILFIKKLLDVNKNLSKESSEELINVITKTSILTVISCIFTIILMISLIFQIFNEEYRNSIIPTWFLLSDSFTNFICISLQFKFFKREFYYFCGCMDRKCKSCCKYLTMPNHLEANMPDINPKWSRKVTDSEMTGSKLEIPTCSARTTENESTIVVMPEIGEDSK